MSTQQATEEIEQAVDAVTDPRQRIPTYLAGVGTSGALLSPTGLSAGQAYTQMADLLLHGLTATPGRTAD